MDTLSTIIIILVTISIIIIVSYFIFFKKKPVYKNEALPLKETEEVLITGAQGTQNVYPTKETISLLLEPSPFERSLPIVWPHSLVPIQNNMEYGKPYSILEKNIPKGWKDYMIPMIILQTEDELAAGPYFLMPPNTSLKFLVISGAGEESRGSISSPKFSKACIIAKITIENYYYYFLWSNRDIRDRLYEEFLPDNEIVTLFCGPPTSDYNTSASAVITIITMKVENCTKFERESVKYENRDGKTVWEGITLLIFTNSSPLLRD